MSDNETNNIYSDLNNISIDKLIEEKYRMRISILKLFITQKQHLLRQMFIWTYDAVNRSFDCSTD